jgi:hypothetical protein
VKKDTLSIQDMIDNYFKLHPPKTGDIEYGKKISSKFPKGERFRDAVKCENGLEVFGKDYKTFYSQDIEKGNKKIQDFIFNINRKVPNSSGGFKKITNPIKVDDTIQIYGDTFYLMGGICHGGGAAGGHYIACVKRNVNNKNEWYYMDDRGAISENEPNRRKQIDASLATQSVMFLYRKEENPKLPEPEGLRNQGQTCYMNALMQLLNTTHNVSTVTKDSKNYPNLHRFVKKVFENPIESSAHYNAFIKDVLYEDDKKDFINDPSNLIISSNSDGKRIQRDSGEVLKRLMTYKNISKEFPVSPDVNDPSNLFCSYPIVECSQKICKNGDIESKTEFQYDILELELDFKDSLITNVPYTILIGDDTTSSSSSSSSSFSTSTSLPKYMSDLLNKQQNEFDGILKNLKDNDKKTFDYAWWVWPTTKPGDSEPIPKTHLTSDKNEFSEFMLQADLSKWTNILTKFTELLNKSGKKNVIPSIDYPRIGFFFDLFLIKFGNFLKTTYPNFHTEITKFQTSFTKKGGKRRTRKSVRKHRGIIQTGGNTGRLRKGYKYTGRRLKNGKAEIVRVKRN